MGTAPIVDNSVSGLSSNRENGTQALRAEIYWLDVELIRDRNHSGAAEQYEIRRDGEVVVTTRGTSWYDNSTEEGLMYVYDVVAVDFEGTLIDFQSVRVQIGAAECR